MIGKHVLAIIVLPVFIGAACAPQLPAYRPALARDGAIHLYLQPLPQEAHRLTFRITAISAIRQDGSPIPLPSLIAELNGKELAGVQKRLASAALPPGSYLGISVEIGDASLLRDDGPADLLVPEDPLLIKQEITVTRRRATALFLSLDPAKLITGGFRFTPTFSLETPRRQLNNLLGFATSSQSNIVTVFNKTTMEVVDTIATGSGPKGAVIDQRRGWVYIALAGDDAIEAIEVKTGEILRRLQLNFGDEPVELALSADGLILVSANYGSNTASIIDADSLREQERVILLSEPTSVVADPSSPRAYLVQPLANAVSAIDVSRRQVAVTRILDETPVRAGISSDGKSLYVITRYSSDLLILDTATLNVIGRIYVDSGAASIKVDPKTNLIYVGKRHGGISVVDPSSLMRIDRFRTSGDAAYLTIDNDENSLIVLLSDDPMVQKLDLISKKVKGVIELLEGSYAVVVMGER